MIAKFYGKTYSLQVLRSRASITKTGVSMLGISDAIESIGFRTRGYRLTWEQFRDEVPLPCIVHWNQRHFVAVYDIKGRANRAGHASRASRASRKRHERLQDSRQTVYVADPAVGTPKFTN
jgi:ATP-binding cassette subfamily B protein